MGFLKVIPQQNHSVLIKKIKLLCEEIDFNFFKFQLKEIREKLRDMRVELGDKAKEMLRKLREKGKEYLKKILEKLGLEKRDAE